MSQTQYERLRIPQQEGTVCFERTEEVQLSLDDLMGTLEEEQQGRLDLERAEFDDLSLAIGQAEADLDDQLAECDFEAVQQQVDWVVACLRSVNVGPLLSALGACGLGAGGRQSLSDITVPAGASEWRWLASTDPDDYLDPNYPDVADAESQARTAALGNRIWTTGDHLRAWFEQASGAISEIASATTDPAALASAPQVAAEYARRIERAHGLWFDALAEGVDAGIGGLGIAGEMAGSAIAWPGRLER